MNTKSLKIIVIGLFCITMLSACGNKDPEMGNIADIPAPTESVTSNGNPSIPSQKPKIPNANDLKASILDHDKTYKWIEDLDEDITRPNISEDEIRQGFYYGMRIEKKYGTPDSWSWVDDKVNSRWVSPYKKDRIHHDESKVLCEKTSGTYIFSCIDSEDPECSYIPESTCQCGGNSSWTKKGGCILIDDLGYFIHIEDDELRQGWYLGGASDKKEGTPDHWVWYDLGEKSRWQNAKQSIN